MPLILLLIAATTFLTGVGCVYYSFFKHPNSLKKLNKDIDEATNSKQSLLQTIDSLEKDKAQSETEYKLLKGKTNEAQGDWNKLSELIKTGQQQHQTGIIENQKWQAQLQRIKTEINNLQATVTSYNQKAEEAKKDLTSLSNKEQQLQIDLNRLKKQLSELDTNVNSLIVERKSLQTENSNLSEQVKHLEIKKKLLQAE
jgi:chromosome segregation ATPase